jgi:diadenosine tetraphosphate (Ap4A) HIT family hydrolase
MIAGLEVPHTHIHLVPINGASDLDFANARPASDEELAKAADTIKSYLER